jgi:hypothetical protein
VRERWWDGGALDAPPPGTARRGVALDALPPRGHARLAHQVGRKELEAVGHTFGCLVLIFNTRWRCYSLPFVCM